MKVKAKTSPLYPKLMDAYSDGQRWISLRGGTRSSKTYQVLMFLLFHIAGQNRAGNIKIARKEYATVRAQVVPDFVEILQAVGLYQSSQHKRSDPQMYTFGSAKFHFIGMDDPRKQRGGKHDVLFMNEVLEFTREDFVQLNMRTYGTGLRIFDYNPSETFHWFYDDVESREDCMLIKSTYKDNPFLPDHQRREIERLAEIDDFYYKVYTLGEPAQLSNTIYTNYEEIDKWPGTDFLESCEFHGCGLDFGAVNPNALVEIAVKEDTLLVRELLYEPELRQADLVSRVKQLVPEGKPVICDTSEPMTVRELQDAGVEAFPAPNKKVYEGIQMVRKYRKKVLKSSINYLKEIRTYKWREKSNGQILDEPVKINDHLMDAERYFIADCEIARNQNIIV